MSEHGKKTWLIPDGYYDSQFVKQVSHDAVCVLNTSNQDATINLTLFFEDREEMGGFTAMCGARRTHHIRMDKLKNREGKSVPTDTPYAILVESDVPVVVQYSRLDTAQDALALMTTIAYAVD
jgi:hypothetical protein